MISKEFLVPKFYSSTSVENIMKVPEVSLPLHVEDETLPKKTSSLWKRKGSSHLSSLAVPDSAPSAGCCLVIVSHNPHPGSNLHPGLRLRSTVMSHKLVEPRIETRPQKAIYFP